MVPSTDGDIKNSWAKSGTVSLSHQFVRYTGKSSMHSSRMRTDRLLTVSVGGERSAQPRGVCIQGALPNPGGGSASGGGVCPTPGWSASGGGSASSGFGQTPP